MTGIRRLCVLIVVGLLAATGLLSTPPARALTFSGQFVSGSLTIMTPDCANDISNNFVNGSLTIIATGIHCAGIDLTMDVYGNFIGGNLNVIVTYNTVDHGNIHVSVHDNPQVGGMLIVHVLTNTVHKHDPATFYDYNLNINVYNNGGNAINIARNEVIAEGILIEANGNWVKNNMHLNIRDNFAALDLVSEANSNMVNNLYSAIERNRACRDLDVTFANNLIDTNFYLNANQNRATRDLRFTLPSNKVLYLEPMRFQADIIDNHAATGDIYLEVSATLAKMIIVKYEDNGAGGDGRFYVLGNIAVILLEVQINRNRVDGRSTIRVMGNNPNPMPYIISHNWACRQAPVLQLQPSPSPSFNTRSCTQMLIGDSDLDGLTDDYEKMIGTDQNNRDTDRDGIWDGWNDADGSGGWDSGEEFGELGDPLRPLGTSHQGAVDTLFRNPNEAPNCFCKDIYIEVDFMEKGRTIRRRGVPMHGLTVNKTADVRQARPGDMVNYTIWYNNSGPVAKHVWINDTLPSLVTYVSATPTPSLVSGNLVRWNFTTVTRGTYRLDMSVNISISASIGTHLVNRVVLNYTDHRGDQQLPVYSNVTVVVSNVKLSGPPGLASFDITHEDVYSDTAVIRSPLPTPTTAIQIEEGPGIPLGGTYSLVDKPHTLTWPTVQQLMGVFKKRGIGLHVDIGWPNGVAGGDALGGGEMLRHKTYLPFRNVTAFDFYNFKNGEVTRDYDGDGMLEPRHFSTNRGGVFRYVIMGHNYSEKPNSSGIGELVGDDFFISHGNFLGFGYSGPGIRQAIAYVFCHELGHNLGLGATPATHEFAPPNYYSCMSYNAAVAFLFVGYSDGLFGTYYDWPNAVLDGGLANWRAHSYTK